MALIYIKRALSLKSGVFCYPAEDQRCSALSLTHLQLLRPLATYIACNYAMPFCPLYIDIFIYWHVFLLYFETVFADVE